jgi:hypothetical protein
MPYSVIALHRMTVHVSHTHAHMHTHTHTHTPLTLEACPWAIVHLLDKGKAHEMY